MVYRYVWYSRCADSCFWLQRGYFYPNAYCNSYRHSNSNSNGNTYAYGNRHSDANGYSYTYCYFNTNCHAHGNSYSYCITNDLFVLQVGWRPARFSLGTL